MVQKSDGLSRVNSSACERRCTRYHWWTSDYRYKMEWADIWNTRRIPWNFDPKGGSSSRHSEKIQMRYYGKKNNCCASWVVVITKPKTFTRLLHGTVVDKDVCGYRHSLEEGIPHAYLLTTRPFKENGDWGNKEKRSYKLDAYRDWVPQKWTKMAIKNGRRNEKLWERVRVDQFRPRKWRRWPGIVENHVINTYGPKIYIDNRSYEDRFRNWTPNTRWI